jgi:hypothetical protein
MSNQSSTRITITGTDIFYSIPLSFQIDPGQSVMLSEWSRWGIITEPIDPKVLFGADLMITSASGDSTSKNYRTLDSWFYTIRDNGGTADHRYVFNLVDSDF